MIRWEALMNSLTEGNIVPVIGNDLSLVIGENNKPIPLYEYIARQLTQVEGISYNNQTIHELTLTHQENQIPNIHNTIQTIYKKTEKEKKFYTKPLEQLAGITDFKFYLTTAIDNLLTEAIRKERNCGDSELDIINYSLQKRSPNPESPKAPEITIFKLMGNLDDLNDCAIDEEKMLEYFFTISWRENHRHPQAESLIQKVKDKIFLFVGCNFPDWFMRFIIRILTNRRIKNDTFRNYVANNSCYRFKKLKNFLDHCENDFIAIDNKTDNAIAFVDQLYKRWIDRKKVDKPIQYKGTVFISYYHKYEKDAENLKDSLEREGIRVWFDRESLKAGKHIDKIKKAIADAECKIFVPFISDDILEDPGSYARKNEWSTAKTVLKYRRINKQQFDIIPYITDNTKRDDKRIPKFIRDFTAIYLNTGKSKIIDEIKEKLKPVIME